MSLKAFHILFVSLAILVTFAFGIWALRAQQVDPRPGTLAWGIISLVVTVALVIYGVAFLKKMKREGIR